MLAFTIAAEIGEIGRFAIAREARPATPAFARGSIQSGESDRRGPLSKHGPTYLRWALFEATMHALKHPAYSERYQRNKQRLGKQRGAKVAQLDIARRLPTRSGTCSPATRPSLPEAPLFVWRPDRPFGLAPASEASDFA